MGGFGVGGWDSLNYHFSAAELILKVKVRRIRYYSIKYTHRQRCPKRVTRVQSCVQSRDLSCPHLSVSFFPPFSPSAPYKAVSKHLQKAADDEQLLLTCQSEGHPKTAAVWRDRHAHTINSSTSFELTPQQLFRASSQIRVPSALRSNYTCSFPHGGSSATFYIPGRREASGETYFLLLPYPHNSIILQK